jgi:hypothetical protein
VGGRGVRPLECAILRKSRAEVWREDCREEGSPSGLEGRPVECFCGRCSVFLVLANYIQIALLNTVESSKV